MAKCVFIVQGEGRGHMSQSIALKEYLEDAGHSIDSVWVGLAGSKQLPDYYQSCFPGKIHTFQSPFFLNTPNQKGIYIGRTLLFNLLRSPVYLREIRRIRTAIQALQPEFIFNFYEVLGARALRKVSPFIKRIGVGHHFYLHLKKYPCEGGALWHRFLLKWHTQMVMKSCDRVLALSLTQEKGDEFIDIIPPLIRKEFRTLNYRPGKRFLAYFLSEGYLYDLILLARKDSRFQADVFSAVSPEIEIPPGIQIHPLGQDKFRELMDCCKAVITTAGFDTAAEAAFHGIPLAVMPARNHFEQRCNGKDISRSGIGIEMDALDMGVLWKLEPKDPATYRTWVDRSSELILINISK